MLSFQRTRGTYRSRSARGGCSHVGTTSPRSSSWRTGAFKARAVGPSGSGPCQVRFYVGGCLCIASAAIMLAVRPFRSVASSVLTACSYVLIAIVSIVMGVSVTSPSATLNSVKGGAALGQICIVVMRVVYDGVVWYLEAKRWKILRNAAADLEDEELSKATQRPT